MIESVQERQKGAFDFARYYENLCALQDSCPVPAVKAHLHEGVLDINGDRIKSGDWDPILQSVAINKNLSFIGVRSYFQLQVDEKTSERRAAILKSRIPVIRSKEMSMRLTRALRDCLSASERLYCVELQGLPLRERDLGFLVKGLVKNDTLKHLSLAYCRIADFGVQIICQALKQAGNVNTLNLTGCSLSFNGMEAIAELIKYQAMSRHNEAWKESLRYRRPNLDSMSGVRRITLNSNPLIDNQGAAIIAEAVKDDLWVKAIDLQHCGIGNVGAKAFLTVLKFNSTLMVLDLRQNPLIDRDILRAVTEQVLVNCNGKDSEYKWLRIDADNRKELMAEKESMVRRSGTRDGSVSGVVARRPAFRPGGVAHTRYLESPRVPERQKALSARKQAEEDAAGARGQPWRTAARATRYKGYPPDHVPGKSKLEEQSEATSNEMSSVATARTDDDVESARSALDDASGREEPSVVSPLVREFERSPPPAGTLKELRIQVMHLRRQLNEETRARRKAEEKMMELMLDNQRLQRDMDRRPGGVEEDMGPLPRRGLNDEKILRNIEQSFRQFHSFLDMLRDAGLGRVVTAAGMDEMPRISAGGLNGAEDAGGDDLEARAAAAMDPVEQSYRSAAHARSEADKLYLRLKEATSRGNTHPGRFVPGASVFPMSGDAWPRDTPPARARKDEAEAEEEGERTPVEGSHLNDRTFEAASGPGEDGAAATVMSPREARLETPKVEEEEEFGEFRTSTPRMRRSDNVSSGDEGEVVGAGTSQSPREDDAQPRAGENRRLGRADTDENVVSVGYNSDTFETSGDEGSRYGRSLGPDDLGRMKASLDSVQESDLQDF